MQLTGDLFPYHALLRVLYYKQFSNEERTIGIYRNNLIKIKSVVNWLVESIQKSLQDTEETFVFSRKQALKLINIHTIFVFY